MVSRDTQIRPDTLIFLSRTGSEPTKNIFGGNDLRCLKSKLTKNKPTKYPN
jgi:hypothetical protein